MTLPSLSNAFVMFIVARIDAMTIHIEEYAMCRPGQILLISLASERKDISIPWPKAKCNEGGIMYCRIKYSVFQESVWIENTWLRINFLIIKHRPAAGSSVHIEKVANI